MHPFVRFQFLIGYCLALLPLHAQDSRDATQADLPGQSAPPAKQEDSRIVGNLSDGTPAPTTPNEAKPRLVFQPDDIIGSNSSALNDRIVTFQKVAPIQLSEPPATTAAKPPEIQSEDLERARDYYRNRKFVSLGASVYSSNPEKPRTFPQIYPNRQNSSPIGIWVNANFLWLTGFAEVEAGDTIYSVLMAISPADPIVRRRKRRSSAARSRFRECQNSTTPWPPSSSLKDIISLVTELRTLLLGEQPTEAISRFSEEKETIEQFARARLPSAVLLRVPAACRSVLRKFLLSSPLRSASSSAIYAWTYHFMKS